MQKNQLYAFTSAACNYLPKVRLLAQSLKQFHPEIRLVLALSDRTPNLELLAGEAWDEIIPLDALDIPARDQWAFTHDIVELSTAIKPFVLKTLLGRTDCAGVFYFDPDMVLFSRLDDLFGLLATSDILLTPHQTRPETSLSRIIDNEICSLKHGTYNLGFIGVRPSSNGMDFARWWSERVYYFCQSDIPNGLFTDQRWIDLVPALFDGVRIVRSPRFNVAPWNLTSRSFSGNFSDGFLVDAEALGFYHFTGFDSGAHKIMVTKYSPDNRSLDALTDWYQRQSVKTKLDPLSSLPWAFGRFSNGSPIYRSHRLIYRSRPDLQSLFPNPFIASEAGSYFLWCQSSGSREYRDLLPVPKKNADWSRLIGPLFTSLATAESMSVPLGERFAIALKDPEQAHLLLKQIFRVIGREGYPGFKRRILAFLRGH
jgi:hypothetical protein